MMYLSLSLLWFTLGAIVDIQSELEHSVKLVFCSVPAEDHLVYLTEHVPGRNQYINAVFMPVSGTQVVRSITAETSQIQCQLFGESLCVCQFLAFCQRCSLAAGFVASLSVPFMISVHRVLFMCFLCRRRSATPRAVW